MRALTTIQTETISTTMTIVDDDDNINNINYTNNDNEGQLGAGTLTNNKISDGNQDTYYYKYDGPTTSSRGGRRKTLLTSSGGIGESQRIISAQKQHNNTANEQR